MASPLGYLDALHEYQDAFLATIPDADPATPVPWCGDWTVEDLVVHLARVHHWAAAQARMVQQTPLGDGPFELAALYAQCAAELRATLAELDPDARARTLLDDGLPPAEQVGTVRFWHRRQALETLVHTWDLRVACGLDFDPGPAAWLDCFDEVVTIMHPRQIRLGRIEAPATRVRFDVEEGATGLAARRAGRCSRDHHQRSGQEPCPAGLGEDHPRRPGAHRHRQPGRTRRAAGRRADPVACNRRDGLR